VVRPNILWLTTEDIGAHLHACGDNYSITPSLDRLAARGCLYNNAWSNAPVCAPARTTIISGVECPRRPRRPHLRQTKRVMSFLDNLENNLTSLESAEQSQEDAQRQRRVRQEELAHARAAAPYADELKNSAFTGELLKQAARIGFTMRTKVHLAWLGATLRLEAKEHRLELRPTPAGIMTVYLRGSEEIRQESLDLKSNPEELVRNWLAGAVV